MICIFIPSFAIYAILNGLEMQNESATSEAIPEVAAKPSLPEFDPVTGEKMDAVVTELKVLSSSLEYIRNLRESSIESYIALFDKDDATVYLTIEDTIYPNLDRYYKEVLTIDKLIETERVRAIYKKIRVGAMGLALAMGQVKNTLTRNNADLLVTAKQNVSVSYGKIDDAEDELAELVEMYVR